MSKVLFAVSLCVMGIGLSFFVADKTNPTQSFSVLSGNESWKSEKRKFSGRVTYVQDGDSFKMGERTVRLQGIDAPEYKQICVKDRKDWEAGKLSTKVLKKLISRRTLDCYEVEEDRYGRLIAHCYLGETNINDLMVRSGWAYAYDYYSKAYVPAEKEAQEKGIGLWQGRCQDPYAWRRQNRR